MRERPIIFSGPMVQAILDGKKTQTRRIVGDDLCEEFEEPDFGIAREEGHSGPGLYVWESEYPEEGSRLIRGNRYGIPGDRLWVRETWGVDCIGALPIRQIDALRFRATDTRQSTPDLGWRPSIHMPRWASRITLEITGLRVEPLQLIMKSKTDARAEGIRAFSKDNVLEKFCWTKEGDRRPWAHMSRDPRDAFIDLWQSINGAGSWAANPWVWVIEFKRIEAKDATDG